MLGHQALSRIRSLLPELDQSISQLNTLRQETIGHIEEARKATLASATELAAVYLPALHEAALAEAERLSGFRGFSRRNPITAMQRERPKLERRLEQIRSTTEYVQRESLVGPYGSIIRAIAEAQNMLEPWEGECGRFETLKGFKELVEIGYDTPKFQGKWWQPSYWRHWSWGDAICEKLGMADFGDDVLPAYEKVRQPRDQWKGELKRLEEQRDGVHALVMEHDQTAERLQNLEQLYLEESRSILGKHLSEADVALLQQWAEGERGIIQGLHLLAGHKAKITYFEDALHRGVDAELAFLRAAKSRLEGKAVKLARPKKSYQEVGDPIGKLPSRLQAFPGRVASLRKGNLRVERFSEYDRWQSTHEDALWWGIFSMRCLHPLGLQVCETTSSHASHPIASTPVAFVEDDFSSAGDIS